MKKALNLLLEPYYHMNNANNTQSTNTAETALIPASELTETVISSSHENTPTINSKQDYLNEENTLINENDKALYKQKSLKVERIVFSY